MAARHQRQRFFQQFLLFEASVRIGRRRQASDNQVEAALPQLRQLRDGRHGDVGDVCDLREIALGIDHDGQAQMARLQVDLQVPVERWHSIHRSRQMSLPFC